MNSEGLVRCMYWIGRARALAALNDIPEMSELLDKAADCLCDAVAPPQRPPQSPPYKVSEDTDTEWME